MDDSCVVCAETLEWVAYGPCGHRDVCSTCVARLRFICDDRRCCICKTESNVVFVTKALGDYTRMINDFSVFPSEPREGKVTSYWYHEDTQAYFDDMDHYKMIKAMCRLSCSVCDKMEDQPNDGPKRQGRFRNIEQLKGHLFHRHKLFMCSLCLEGRKIFICEQKLYTRAQLNQHIDTGNFEVDGSESERGGFTGHPLCEFCRSPFYGDNELYTHMSTEHYTCHICQRQHPGQYEYYKNYDDLEIHFRRAHFLCEDEACLAKKFVVFASESEMKRHNTLEHGGHMSRSKRSAALQIPTSFRFRRSNEQDTRRGRERTFRRDSSINLEMSNSDGVFQDPSSTSSVDVVSDHMETNDIDIVQPFESLATSDSEPPSRYLQALGQNSSRAVPLEESSFPPLPMSTGNTRQNRNQDLKKTMAAHLRRQNNRNINVLHSNRAWNATNHGPGLPSNSSTSMPTTTVTTNAVNATSSSSSGSIRAILSAGSSSSSKNSGSSSRTVQNPVETSGSRPLSDFPPVYAAQMHNSQTNNQVVLNAGDVQTANKSLVEKIRAGLEFDEDKYAAFKCISGDYRQGLIGTPEYLAYVQQFGLSHLVLDLAKLCPNPQKQKELIGTYNASLRSIISHENGGSVRAKDTKHSKTGKGKYVEADEGRSKDKLADSIINSVRELQSSYQPSEAVEVLSKDGYRSSGKGKTKVEDSTIMTGENGISTAGRSNEKEGGRGGGGKQRKKKTPKFHRARLGDGSVAALLDLKHSDSDPDPDPDPNSEPLDLNNGPANGLPVRGVWQKGGGQRLFGMDYKK